MKTKILFILLCFLMIKAEGQTCTVGINAPATVNGITVTGSGTGSIYYSPYTYTLDCLSFPVGNLQLGTTTIPTSYTYTYTFTQPVNNIVLLVAALNQAEIMTITTNNGGISTSLSQFGCGNFNIIGNTLNAGTGLNYSSGFVRVNNCNGFTTLTLAGPSDGTGTIVGLCANSIMPFMNVAPSLSSYTVTNSCPATTVNLNSFVTSITTNLVWFTNNNHTGTQYATPTAATAGTYYAFYFDGTCYSPASAAVTVTINACDPCIIALASATPITGTGVDNTITNVSLEHFKTYKIEQDITIAGNTSFVNSEIIISPNVTITVSSGATLNINSSHLHTCSGMWKGINVLEGGKVDLQGKNHFIATVIEDAEIAVNYDFPSGTVAYTGNLLNTNFTIFNRNKVGVKISNYQVDANGESVFPFVFDHCVFTSRKIDLPNPKPSTGITAEIYPTIYHNNFLINDVPLFVVHPQPLPPLFEPIPSYISFTTEAPLSLSTPYISNILYPDNVPESYLKGATSGYTTNKPNAGIVLENIALQQLGGAIKIGTTYNGKIMPNVFDNLKVGIDATASNINVQTCVFQKPPQSLSTAVGINLKDGSQNNAQIGLAPTWVSYGLTNYIVDNTFNAFYDMPTAIKSDSYNKLNIQNSVFRSSRSAAVSSFIGENGIVATSDGFSDLRIVITNLQT